MLLLTPSSVLLHTSGSGGAPSYQATHLRRIQSGTTAKRRMEMQYINRDMDPCSSLNLALSIWLLSYFFRPTLAAVGLRPKYRLDATKHATTRHTPSEGTERGAVLHWKEPSGSGHVPANVDVCVWPPPRQLLVK